MKLHTLAALLLKLPLRKPPPRKKRPLKNVRRLPLEPKPSSKLRPLKKKPLVRLSSTRMRTRFANLNFK